MSSGKRKISDTDKQHNVFINADSIELYCEGRCVIWHNLNKTTFLFSLFISVEITYNGRKKKAMIVFYLLLAITIDMPFLCVPFILSVTMQKYYSLNIFV